MIQMKGEQLIINTQYIAIVDKLFCDVTGNVRHQQVPVLRSDKRKHGAAQSGYDSSITVLQLE